MKIREKLTIQFSTIVFLILIVFSASIYFVSKWYRYNAFKGRLMEKALNTARLLIEVNEIDINLLKNLRRNYLQSLPDEFVRVYDKNNNAIFKDDTVNYHIPVSSLNEVRKDRELDFKISDRQYVAIRYKEGYVIVASARNIYGAEELNHLAFILFTGNLLCLIVILLSGSFFSRQALRPISRMVTEVEKMGESDLSRRLDEGMKKDELSHLAITFNKLFSRIEDAFERQKRFVSNASHELRTPLTTITGEIEVALMKDRSREQYIQVLLSILEEAKTLTKLSNDLLKLTQTGDMKGIVIQRIDVMDLLQSLAEENYRRNNDTVLHFQIEEELPKENFSITGNIDLLKVALINVIENAYKFSGRKPVTLILSKEGKSILLTVKDEGIGMTEEEISFIFQPFYRSENAVAIEGSGIGLSLTEKIIKLHGGTIAVSSMPRIGTEVRITLPVE